MTDVLEATGLVVSYSARGGDVRAVDGIDITVGRGEVVALVGETGSGKTTAALTAVGLRPRGATRVAGRISIAGQDVTDWSPKRLESILGREVGLVPQDPTSSLDPLKTVGWQVGEAIRIHGERDRDAVAREVAALLARVGFDDVERVARSYPHELSGGQRQRILIAGAIALRPALLVADESTSALDVTVQRRVLDLLDELRTEDGMGILLVTHDLAVAAERADRIMALKDGRVQESGPTSRILTRSADRYTTTLIANAPALREGAFRPEPAGADREPIISIGDVTKEFHPRGGRGAVQALRGVSLAVSAGTTHAIVGESGSGKSTLARIVLGLETASSGSVVVDGAHVPLLRGAQRKAFRKRVQFVHQSPYASLDPSMSILRTVSEPLRRFGLAKGREAWTAASEILDRVALSGHLHGRRPRELSGGQRQRVAIARALAASPSVLVLDEPVSALDVTVQTQILELLDELQQELGLTYLFISHDLSVVREISDAVTVLNAGAVEESGPTAQIFTAAHTDYTRSLLDAIPRPRGTGAA